ncbi:cysteine dioxygenase family protein [Saccharopolyspora shandongensis]|uniref:Cysteine dioxygenase type I n=1 Tax=Saccharopolyspora shandongensis TaxID=418495 RepID=A0A1H3L1M7_9PSEU|nr:cysteine dioxygenase family protein [Saccharopolyspora shandongensis]SDY57858.1 Cysteine dioxygenase type I [Saccharopolyspora shandongensis]
MIGEPTAPGLPARRARRIGDVPGGFTIEALPGRYLDQGELLGLVAGLARRPETWRHHVAFSDEKRHYASLHRDAHVDVWVLCWTPENDTGWHDHDISAFAVAVARGALVEHNLAVAGPSAATEVAAGFAYGGGPDHIHRLTGQEPRSVSIHAYSPPLWRMGQYSVTDGVIRRVSVSYAEELRPIDDTAPV